MTNETTGTDAALARGAISALFSADPSEVRARLGWSEARTNAALRSLVEQGFLDRAYGSVYLGDRPDISLPARFLVIGLHGRPGETNSPADVLARLGRVVELFGEDSVYLGTGTYQGEGEPCVLVTGGGDILHALSYLGQESILYAEPHNGGTRAYLAFAPDEDGGIPFDEEVGYIFSGASSEGDSTTIPGFGTFHARGEWNPENECGSDQTAL